MLKNLRGDKILLNFYSSEKLKDRKFVFNFLLFFTKLTISSELIYTYLSKSFYFFEGNLIFLPYK